ncbi:hypothetical protein AMTR_s00013p00234740 [Amborella trichopoda]|uniref:Uncharacterized protein n=1 Tax=Amborella trichopoda TaxID=13333 RepID=W1PQC9_AMBTC|nr:hypothetical protein AMTR_s00013p00234740 [Amborella trichopoda]
MRSAAGMRTKVTLISSQNANRGHADQHPKCKQRTRRSAARMATDVPPISCSSFLYNPQNQDSLITGDSPFELTLL